VYDKESAISALFGGLAYCVPALLSNIYVHHTKRLKSAVVSAYLGTVYRFIMVSAILVYLFEETELYHAVMIGCFCLATVVQYVTSFCFFKRN
jgi:F0F1-type ATP synthase assembly protein I